MKLLVDMNLSPRWVSVLATLGSRRRTGQRSATPRPAILAYAKANCYVVLTHDLDFGTILAATGGDKPSVVQIRSEDVSPDAIGRPVIEALRQMTSELERGALLSFNPNSMRVRILPLQKA